MSVQRREKNSSEFNKKVIKDRRIPLSIPHMEGVEVENLVRAFQSNWITTVGPELDALEEEFEARFGLPCLAVNSGTSAIHLGLKALGVGVGDEVVSQSLTFAASCNPILYERARPVFIDSESKTWNLDPNILSEFLGARAKKKMLPRAVIVVHLFGQPADMDSIASICRMYDVPVLEDAAESLGALYKGRHPGTFGNVGAFSFNGNKMITGSGGGMFVSPDRSLVKKARFWSTQSRDEDPLGIGNYVHSEVGYNYRLSNLLAGLVRGQLGVLDQRVKERRAVFARYQNAFSNVDGLSPQPECLFSDAEPGQNGGKTSSGESLHTRWLSCFLVDSTRFGMSSSELITYLSRMKIESRPVWKPMHLQKVFREYEFVGGNVAGELHQSGICLPSSSNLSLEDQEIVIKTIMSASELKR